MGGTDPLDLMFAQMEQKKQKQPVDEVIKAIELF